MKKTTIRSFIICAPHQILFRWSNQAQWDGLGMWSI